MRGRQTQGEEKARVTVRVPESDLDDVETVVDGVERYGRCDFIRDAVREKLERDDS